MSKRKLITDAEKALICLDMDTRLLAKRPDDLIEYSYSGTREAVEKARIPLLELGMYQQIKDAVDEADILRKRGEYKIASNILYVTFRELMRRSGTDARMGRKYAGLSLEQASKIPYESPEDLLDEVEPDVHNGAFWERATEQERSQVIALETTLYRLRTSFLVAQHKPSEDCDAVFAKARAEVAAAEKPLKELGLYRSLLETLSAGAALVREKKAMEAHEDIARAATVLAERSGLAVVREQMLAAKSRRKH